MIGAAPRWALGQLWTATGRAEADRALLYGGATGLRILCFHETAGRTLAQLREVVAWCRDHLPFATPAAADALFAGRWSGPDRVLLTFDDGLASNHAAAELLARAGVQGVFFVIPSLVGRTFEAYVRAHEERGVRAHVPRAATDRGGVSRSQLAEMAAMGHRIGAHNFAHRDLGRLHEAAEVRYEIADALDGVAELTGAPCLDFAIGFGQPENLSDEAAALLLARCPRVYACHRGLNAPGRTPRFLLRHAVEPEHPFAFTRACVTGAGDRRLAPRARELLRRVGALPATPATSPPA